MQTNRPNQAMRPLPLLLNLLLATALYTGQAYAADPDVVMQDGKELILDRGETGFAKGKELRTPLIKAKSLQSPCPDRR